MLSAFLPALRLLAHAAGGAVGGRPRAPARSITCSGCRGQDTAAGTPGRGRENPSERAHVLSLAWLSSSTSSVKKLLFSVLPALEEMPRRLRHWRTARTVGRGLVARGAVAAAEALLRTACDDAAAGRAGC